MTQALREIHYTLLNPTGNITLLVESSVPLEEQPALAKKLMELEPETEQVGFVKFFPPDGVLRLDADVELRMAGGEFCGNATMSAAALYLERTAECVDPPAESGWAEVRTAERTVTVRVSGTAEPVRVRMEALEDGSWRGTVAMPRPEAQEHVRANDGSLLPVVRFPGISHVIVEEQRKESGSPSSGNRQPISRADAEKLAPLLCSELGAEALGLMFLNREEGTLHPLVYVPEAGTLVWESSCASGTTAVGAWLAAGQKNRSVRLSLRQPGGTLEITAEPDGALSLTGMVRMMRSGTSSCAGN